MGRGEGSKGERRSHCQDLSLLSFRRALDFTPASPILKAVTCSHACPQEAPAHKRAAGGSGVGMEILESDGLGTKIPAFPLTGGTTWTQ